MKITLRGTAIGDKRISNSLLLTETHFYRSLGLIIIGFNCEDDDLEDYGLMLYYRNRLIKAYKKVGYQKQPNEKGVGVIGVAELTFLQPTHNKQDFIEDEKYNSVMLALGSKLNDYWNANVKKLESFWVQCDQCNELRRLSPETLEKDIPEQWFCYMNKDERHNRCEDEEENEEQDEMITSSNTLVSDTSSTSSHGSFMKATFEKSVISRKRSLFQADPNSTIDTSLEDGQSRVKVSKPKRKILNTVDSTINSSLVYSPSSPSSDVEKQVSQGENISEYFYKEKIKELKTKLSLRIRMLDETEEKLRTFQYNVHRLLSLIVPGRIVGDISQIERNVEEMIKMNETESRRDFEVKDPKKKPSTSFLASSSCDDVPVKDNQCCLS